MFNLFRLCQNDEISFDIVAETGNIVTKNGNNVEAAFHIVERIVQPVAFDNVAWTLFAGVDGALRFHLHGHQTCVPVAVSEPPCIILLPAESINNQRSRLYSAL